MELIKSIFGAERQGGSEIPTRIDGKALKCLPGVRIAGKESIKEARNTGWFCSYDAIKETLNTTDYVIDYAKFEALDNKIDRFCTRLVMIEAKNRNQELTQLTPDAKTELRKLILTQIFGNDRPSGFFVLRLKKDLQYMGSEKVKVEMEKVKSLGVMPPVYIKYSAVEKLVRQGLFVQEDETDASMTLSFNTSTCKNSTSTTSAFGTDFEFLELAISKIELDNSVVKEDLENFLDKTTTQTANVDSLKEIVDKLDTNIADQNGLRAQLEIKRMTTNQTQLQIQHVLSDQNDTIAALQHEINLKRSELEEKNVLLENITASKIAKEVEHEEIVRNLTNEIKMVESALRKVKEENKEMVPMSETIAIQNEQLELKEKKSNAEAALKKEKLRSRNLKKEHADLLNETEDLKGKLETLNEKFDQAMTTLNKKEAESLSMNEEIKKLNDKLNRVKKVSELSQSLSEEVSTADELLSTSKLERPKLKRQMKVEDVTHLVSETREAISHVSAVTNKEITQLLPKWSSGTNTSDFIRKIKKAWNFCSKQDCSEESFCDILRTQLPIVYDELIDELEEDQQKKVDSICEALRALDKQKEEYLMEYSSAKKKGSETHLEFAARLTRYYARGTGNNKVSDGEKLALVQVFLNGLSQSEATALRLCASAEELADVKKLALRASRSRSTATQNDQVNALQTEVLAAKAEIAELRKKTQYPSRQDIDKKKRQGSCNYCNNKGHWWRECRKRANAQPNWKPGMTRKLKNDVEKKSNN